MSAFRQLPICKDALTTPSTVLCSKAASAEWVSDSMVVSVGLQLIYISKFFIWEMGYMQSLDIIVTLINSNCLYCTAVLYESTMYMSCWNYVSICCGAKLRHRFVKFVVYDNTSSVTHLMPNWPFNWQMMLQWFSWIAPLWCIPKVVVQYSLVQISPSQMWTAPMQLRRAVVPFSSGKDLGLNYTIEFLMVSEDIPQMSNLRVNFSTLR